GEGRQGGGGGGRRPVGGGGGAARARRPRRGGRGRTRSLWAHGAELGSLSGAGAGPPLKKIIVRAAPLTARHLPAVHRSRAKSPSARHDFCDRVFLQPRAAHRV